MKSDRLVAIFDTGRFSKFIGLAINLVAVYRPPLNSGVEKIREERIGNSITRLVYVLKLEQAPTVWEFYFYRPRDKWFIANVMFNDQFHLLHKVE